MIPRDTLIQIEVNKCKQVQNIMNTFLLDSASWYGRHGRISISKSDAD